MKYRYIFSALFAIMAGVVSYAKVVSNVIIDKYDNEFIIETKSDGVTPSVVKNRVSATYKALRNPTTAVFYVFYDDFIKIDKAKSKGAKPIYAKARSAGVFFDDSKICYLPVPLEKIMTPSTASIERTFLRPEFCDLVRLHTIYPIDTYNFTLRMPVALKDRFDVVVRNSPEDITIDRAVSPNGKEYVITVKAEHLRAIESEDSSPEARYIAPYITITGFFPGVEELYDTFHSYVAESDPGEAAVSEKAAEITSGCSDDLCKIKAVHDWVHENVRYIAIENGELGHAPDPASVVLSNRYGDCKGSSSLIVGMLRSLGIDARLVWIGTSSIPEDWSDRPSFSTGNHMISAVRLPNDSILFIDGTTGPTDFGFIPPSIQGKQALVENGDTYRLERVPVLPAETNVDSIVTTLELNGSQLSGRMSEYMLGVHKVTIMNGLRDVDSKKREKLLIRTLALGRKNVKLSAINVENNALDGAPICVSGDIELPNVTTVAGDKTYLRCASLFPEIVRLTIETKDRRYPAVIPYRHLLVCRNEVRIPETLSIEAVPEGVDIDNKWITASLSYAVDGDILRCDLVLKFKETFIPLDSIPEYNESLRTLVRAISQNLTLKQN